MCNFWRHNTKYRYQIPAVLLIWFLGCSLTNMTVVSLDHLNATFWPFKHCTIKKSVYWVLIIAIWLTALLFSCALIMIYYYGGLLFLRLDFIHLNLSFTHLTFLFCKASLWKSARQTGKGNLCIKLKKKRKGKKEKKLNSSDYFMNHLLLNVVPLYVSCVRFHFAFCSFEFENLHFFRFSSASVLV